MSAVAVPYVQLRDKDYYVGSTRVTLRSVVAGWRRGETPEYIQEGFPSLTLAQVFGAIAFYLDHQNEVDANFREMDELRVRLKAEEEAKHPEFYAEMRRRIAEHHAKQGESTAESNPE